MENKHIVCDALATISPPIFLAGLKSSKTARVTLYVGVKHNSRALCRKAETALANVGVKAVCAVRPLPKSRLSRTRSLEAALRCFGDEQVVYDPTGSVSRGQALLRCCAAVRSVLAESVIGFYAEPTSRTLYVLIEGGAVSRDGTLDKTSQRELEAKVAKAVADWVTNDPFSFSVPVRLCVALPSLPLVPVDKVSPIRSGNWRGRLHSGLLVGGLTTLLGVVGPGVAQADGPAVSQVNGKMSGAGGDIAGHGGGVAEGSITLPIGQSFGAQFDGEGGSSNQRFLWGVAGQAFWRDPTVGLLGGVVTRGEHGILNPKRGPTSAFANRYGAEGEVYLGQFTPSAAAGYQEQLSKKGGGFLVLDLAWYPTDDLQLSAGGDLNVSRSRALLGAEYQTGIHLLGGLTTFAEAGITGSRDSYALAGFRVYFGPDKTLIRRHREDDPTSPIVSGVGALAAGYH